MHGTSNQLNSLRSLLRLNYEKESIDYDNFSQCPDDYQKIIIRILAMQAYAERAGAIEVAGKIDLAPDFKARRQLAQIAHEEAVHACLLYGILDRLGVTEDQALEIAGGKDRKTPQSKSLEGPVAVGDDDNVWIDIALNAMLLDRAGCYMVGNFSQSSFKPWAKACQRIYKDELFHKSFGLGQFRKYISKPHDQEELREKFMIWFARGMNFFGPPNVRSQDKLKEYGIKRVDNESLRRGYFNEVKKMMAEMGLEHFMQPFESDVYPYQSKAASS